MRLLTSIKEVSEIVKGASVTQKFAGPPAREVIDSMMSGQQWSGEAIAFTEDDKDDAQALAAAKIPQ